MTVTKNDLTETQTRIDLWHMFATLIAGAAFSLNIDANQAHNHWYRQNPSANNDQWQHTVYLKAGIYDLWLLHLRDPSGGLLDITVHSPTDTDTVQTVDFYNAGILRNQISIITFTVQRDGQHWVNGRVNGHTAPSAGYDCFVTMMALIHR